MSKVAQLLVALPSSTRTDRFDLFCIHKIRFFCRIRFDYSECLVGPTNTQVLEHAVGELAKRYEMEWRIYYDNKVKRVAILVSKLDHCLYDLLIRLKAGELSCQVLVIISNHPDLAPIAQQFGVAFRCVHLLSENLEKKRKDYTFRRQFNEKPSIIPGSPV